MQVEIKRVIETVGKEKNIDKQLVLGVLKEAVLSAAKKYYGECDFEAKVNEETDEVELWRYRRVVENDAPTNPLKEIKLAEALEMDESAQLGDDIGEGLSTEHLGRIAAQAAKQVIVQKMIDAEKEKIIKEFRDRKGQLVTGQLRRFDKSDLIVDLGSCEGVLPIREQIPGEKFKLRDKITCFLLDVKKSSRGPQIILSRSHPEVLVRLFEQEVSEIAEGIVTIQSAARDPGSRSKIAVSSNDSSVDPVGACVGMKGARVQAVVQELRGEKIDIIPYDRDAARFVCNALAPAEVSKVIVNERARIMEVIVPDDHLSLAIGKRGQNVRLAAQLTGWKLDIRSESKMKELVNQFKTIIAQIPALGEMRAEILVNEGYKDPADIAQLDQKTLIKLLRLSPEEADQVIKGAEELAASTQAEKETELDDTFESIYDFQDAGEKDKEAVEREEAMLESLVSKQKAAPLLDPDKVDARSFEKEELSYWMKLRGVGEHTAAVLCKAGFKDYDSLAGTTSEDVAHRTGLPLRMSQKLHTETTKMLGA